VGSAGGLCMGGCAWRAEHRRMCMVGCAWRAVYGGLCMEGCAWRTVHGGLCMVGCAWWAVHGGLCTDGCALRLKRAILLHQANDCRAKNFNKRAPAEAIILRLIVSY
jgi:hypothetical protein